jgi:hypothetical protein
MGNINDAFPSLYLKAADLRGQAAVVTIERVEFEPVGRAREMKAVVYFVGKSKGLIVNKTNAKKLTELANSPLTEDWAGVAITLYPTETEFSGETVDCIRIKAAAPRQAKLPTPRPVAVNETPRMSVNDEDIPF